MSIIEGLSRIDLKSLLFIIILVIIPIEIYIVLVSRKVKNILLNPELGQKNRDIQNAIKELQTDVAELKMHFSSHSVEEARRIEEGALNNTPEQEVGSTS